VPWCPIRPERTEVYRTYSNAKHKELQFPAASIRNLRGAAICWNVCNCGYESDQLSTNKNDYKNTRENLHKTIAVIRFNKMCTFQRLTPQDIQTEDLQISCKIVRLLALKLFLDMKFVQRLQGQLVFRRRYTWSLLHCLILRHVLCFGNPCCLHFHG
jgi:hypothetical protein